MVPVPIERLIVDRQTEWLRENYKITPDELYEAPSNVRSEIHAAWVRYWRDECAAGRGVSVGTEPGKLRRGSRRTA